MLAGHPFWTKLDTFINSSLESSVFHVSIRTPFSEGPWRSQLASALRTMSRANISGASFNNATLAASSNNPNQLLGEIYSYSLQEWLRLINFMKQRYNIQFMRCSHLLIFCLYLHIAAH